MEEKFVVVFREGSDLGFGKHSREQKGVCPSTKVREFPRKNELSTSIVKEVRPERPFEILLEWTDYDEGL